MRNPVALAPCARTKDSGLAHVRVRVTSPPRDDSRRAEAMMPLGPEIVGISVVISPLAARLPVTPQSRSTRSRSLTSGPWLAGAWPAEGSEQFDCRVVSD